MQRNTIVRVAVVILVVLLVPILLVTLGRGTKQTGHVDALQQEYDRIRAEGQPLTFEELDAWYERPADNAADLYLQAAGAYVEPSAELKANLPFESGGDLPQRGQPLPETTRLAMQEHVRLNSRCIALLQDATTHPHCRYPIDLRKGPATDLAHLAKIRALARLLGDHAALLADTGDTNGATEALVELFALADSLQNEPVLISQLVRAACAQIGTDALNWAVNRAAFNDEQLVKLSAALEPSCNERTFWRGFVGERCTWVGVWDSRIGPGIEATLGALPPELRSKFDMDSLKKHIEGPLFEQDLMYMLGVYDLAIQGAKLPPGEGRDKIQEAKKLAQEAPANYLITRRGGQGSDDSDLCHILRGAEARDRMVAASRDAAAALAAKRH